MKSEKDKTLPTDITVDDTEAVTSARSMLVKTVDRLLLDPDIKTRLLQIHEENPNQKIELKCYHKWGMDGSGSQRNELNLRGEIMNFR